MNFAKRSVEAFQNSLIDRLLMRLWPLVFVAQGMAMETRTAGRLSAWDHFVIIGLLAGVFCGLAASTLGFLAMDRRPAGGGTLQRLVNSPPHELDVWSMPPAGGLRPPRLTRAVVIALGKGAGRETRWLSWLIGLVVLAALTLVIISHVDQSLLASASPSLAGPAFRVALLWVIAVVMAAANIRAWAVECRALLAAGG